MEQNEKMGVYSIGINLLLVGIKGLLSYLSGSVALVADAIHSFTDVISSITVLAGIKISKRKSKAFPYGLYKVENFVSLLSSFFIFLAGYEIVHMVLHKPQSIKTEYLPYAVTGVLLTMGITFAFSRYELRRGKEIGSPSLVADAEHIRTDMLSSSVILVALLGWWFGLNLDKIAAIIVVFLVFKAGIGIFIDAFRVLLDASVDFETMDQVKTIILRDPRVISINALWGRNSGPFKFIEADIVIKVNNLEKAHSVCQKIEGEIKKNVFHVDHVLIHYEPQKKKTRTLAIPLKEDKHSLSEHFGEAPYFYLVTIRERDGVILSEAFHANPFAGDEKGKGIKVSEWLLEKETDTVYSPKGLDGKGPGYVFSDAGVEVLLTDGRTLDDIQRGIKEAQEVCP
ncbi:MAG: cation diffusion facilitator family transporter [Thermodesulfobacteriota bacterium]|nr:cation diffusion facilitator family transporter [Thermodesulfobacteriota bacterium]